MIENVDIEFKLLNPHNGALPDGISKVAASFANTEGGELYIGIADDGTVVGVDDPDDVMTRLSNTLHDTILPDIMPFVQIRAVRKDGKTVVRATISVGTERPYYLAKEGLKPKGVYIRRGSSCIPLGESGIREMIADTSGKSFEESRSFEQELTFDYLQQEMNSRKLEFGMPQMKTLGLIGEDSLYTNLALLLSEQCPYTIKAAIFQGKDSSVFRERREFDGSLLKQLNDAYRFLDFYNRTEAAFIGLERHDRRDYPEEAIREALLNSIIHRDYLFSGSTIINMYEDHVEFISLGGLVRGLSMEAIYLGVSQSKNPHLAAVLYRLGLVESYGTGVRKILRSFEDTNMKPVFKTVEGVFTVTMYNRNNASPAKLAAAKNPKQPSTETGEEFVLSFIKEKGEVTRKDIEEKFGFGTTKAYNYLKRFCDENILTQIKNGRFTVYTVTKNK